MFEPQHMQAIRAAIRRQTESDAHLLRGLREDVVRHLRPARGIRSHSATAVSLVASDGGNNRLNFDPFHMQLVRVVDSQGEQLFVDVVSPTTDPDELVARHRRSSEDPLRVLMDDLGVDTLNELSNVIPTAERVRAAPDELSPSWVLVYRDLCEWAVLYQRVTRSSWGSHTLLVRDGLLRSTIFANTKFVELRDRMLTAIEEHRRRNVKVFLVGIAKHSRVLARYRLALALENGMPPRRPCYVAVPREIERKVYKWREYARGVDDRGGSGDAGTAASSVIGSMFLVRFGSGAHDPIWALDLLETQVGEAPEILGHLLADAVMGFPVPFYPLCLQRAHEHAQVVDLDLDLLQDTVLESARGMVELDRQPAFDALQLAPDVAARRYG
jgi:hypothetical protein